MHHRLLAAALCAGLWTGPALSQATVFDHFDALNARNWCGCRMDAAALEPGLDPDGTRFGRITVAPRSVGGNQCTKEEKEACRLASGMPATTAPAAAAQPIDSGNDLGPSLIRRPAAESLEPSNGADFFESVIAYPKGGPNCTEAIRERGRARGEEVDSPCVQREEIALRDGFPHEIYPQQQSFDYTIRFRMPPAVQATGDSVRWVTAQWKQDTVDVEHYRARLGAAWEGTSPFLAQRYDDGILYVTVQDEDCRCMVAWAKHDKQPVPRSDGQPARCESTIPEASPETECRSNLKVKYFGSPLLASPAGAWTEMRYRVQAGRSAPSRIEIHQDGRKVVEVTGPIGYAVDKNAEGGKTNVYFKFGHYRDYMDSTDAMDVDWVKVEPSPKP